MNSPAISRKPLPVYKRRKSEATVLYQVLQEHLETFLTRVEGTESGANWPGFVKRELKAFLE